MRLFLKGECHVTSRAYRLMDPAYSAQWGFHPGGWGKPPLDEYNRPLYGDVFGVVPKNTDADVSRLSRSPLSWLNVSIGQMGEPVDRNLWGELEPEEGS